MKHGVGLAIILFFISLSSCKSNSQSTSTGYEDIYLGQRPPGLVPELFAPDIIQTEFREGGAAYSPDLKEFYFRRRGGEYENNALVFIEYIHGSWEESIVASRSREPFISPDGEIMHLGNNYRERTSSGWSEEKVLGYPFDDVPIMRLTASSDKTYYFDELTNTGGNISYSRLINGAYEKPRTLTEDIDMGIWKAHPFIAPDESYLIWDDQRESGFGSSDLYISYRLNDGSWSAAINLGNEINTEYEDAYGSVTSDGKYFFFNRSFGDDSADIFWVDAQFIESLRPVE